MTFNNKAMTFGSSSKWMAINSYNPLDLPPYTIRCKFSSGYTPTMGTSQTLVDASENIWDIYKSNTNWGYLFLGKTQLEEVIAANTTGVSRMESIFDECTSLTTVPLFDTSSVTTMSWMFQNCYAVESGALALYQQASTQASPPTSHSNAFTNCGRDTVTGAIELNQIPADWGGTSSSYEEEIG